MKTAGIDGCKKGWLVISFDDKAEGYKVIQTPEELHQVFRDHDRILIDMPIGLEDEEYHRECDVLMRKALGSDYAPSVFTPPIRPALHAPSYAEANMISYEYTEMKLSLQAWNIVPKIQQVDELLQKDEALREKVLESHPEYLFQKLNGGMLFQKKNLKKGIKHRLDLVKEKERIADDFFRDIKEEYRRNEVAEDDIVDAMVLALFAKWSADKELKTIPEEAPHDSVGLKKAYHYV